MKRSTINKKHIAALALFLVVYTATLLLLVLPQDLIRPSPTYKTELAQN